MDASITKSSVDLVQGVGKNNERFGYVHGDDGGFFFTWKPTLEATLASVEVDEVDGAGDLDESDVIEFLTEYLPTTKKGIGMWSE